MDGNMTIPGLAGGRSFDDFIGGASSADREFMSARVTELKVSSGFERAVGEFEGLTLVFFADMECPDCRAVLPFLGKIQAINPRIRLVARDWNDASEAFLEELLGAGRVPTILALDASGDLMDGAFIERPLAVHRASAEAPSDGEALAVIRTFRGGGANERVEEDLLRVLRGEKTDVLPYLR
ncbi:MAG: thioredoxin family protein [Synergistaceae bacterium]|jgi:thiol-disulfide isomerase/thioredoxin|nr:thioredoxin family protein [Synergistaceae bacterium]